MSMLLILAAAAEQEKRRQRAAAAVHSKESERRTTFTSDAYDTTVPGDAAEFYDNDDINLELYYLLQKTCTYYDFGITVDLDFISDCALSGIYISRPKGKYLRLPEEKDKVDKYYLPKNKKRAKLIYKIKNANETFSKFVQNARLVYPGFLLDFSSKVDEASPHIYLPCRKNLLFAARLALNIEDEKIKSSYRKPEFSTADEVFKSVESTELERNDILSNIIDSKLFKEATIIGKRFIISEIKIFLEEINKITDIKSVKMLPEDFKSLVDTAKNLLKSLEEEIIGLEGLEEKYLGKNK